MSEEPSEDEVQSIFKIMQERKRTAVDPVDLQEVTDAENTAKELYESRANRAEWLSVADRIGSALVKYNAAKQGLKHGVDMSGIKLENTNDWDKSIDRYGRDLDRDLKSSNQRRDALLEDRKNRRKEADEKDSQEERLLRDKYDFAKTKYSQAVSEQGQDKRSIKQAEKEKKDRENKIADDEKKEAARLAKEERDSAAKIDKEVRGELGRKVESSEKADKAMTTLLTTLNEDTEFTDKNIERLQLRYGKMAADAGVELGELSDLKKQLKTAEPAFFEGLFGGLTTEQAKAKRDEILAPYEQKNKKLAANYKAQLDAMRSGPRRPIQVDLDTKLPAKVPPIPKEAPLAQGQVLIKGPSGQVVEMPEADAAIYLSKPGYSKVK
jgi:hypothetical protein